MLQSFQINRQRGVDQVVDLALVVSDGTPVDITGADVVETVRNGAGETVLQKTAAAGQIRLTDPVNGRYRIRFDANDVDALVDGTYIHDVLITLVSGVKISAVPPSFFLVSSGGVTAPTLPQVDNRVTLNHDFDVSDSLRYMDAGGNPIADANVYVYRQADYAAGILTTPVGVTVTKADGRWREPIRVQPGFDYVVRFEAPMRFGPDVVTITV